MVLMIHLLFLFQESLASVGQVISRVGSGGTSPGTEASDAPHNSLLSELDTSYRILIEKYEALLEAREIQQQQQHHENDLNHEGLIHPGVDDLSGPMSLVMTDGMHDTTITAKCHHCHTCTCDLKPVSRPKSNMEEFSEVETSSSGFSDGESRLSNKSTQTEEEVLQRETFGDLTPTPILANKCLDLSSPINPCDKRFQAAPEYKKLFQEIFTVLKQTVDEKEPENQPSKASVTPQASEVICEDTSSNIKPSSPKEVTDGKNSSEESNINQMKTEGCDTSLIENSTSLTPVPVNIKSSSNVREEKEIITITKEFSAVQPSQISDAKNSSSVVPTEDSILQGKREHQVTPEDQRILHKPPRPDSLDLGSDSRPSSRQRRRRRQQRIRLESHQQQHYQYTQGNQNTNILQQLGSHHNRRQHRRDKDSSSHQNHQSDDFPVLQTQLEGEPNKTRIIYNSSRGRCEHHRSRKRRDRSSNSHHHKHQQQENTEQGQHSQHEYQKQQTVESDSKGKATTPKIGYPSVEVAKLRKLEMTYAEALKNSMNRSYYNRRY